jgi:hypothetical protein
LVLRNA